MAVCHVLLAGFPRLEAELLMAGLERRVGTGLRTKLVPERQLAESAARWGATALLLGAQLEEVDQVIADCQERSPELVLVQLSASGTAALVRRWGKSDLLVPEISIDMLALLLCGDVRSGSGPHPKSHPASQPD
jgi:hypothetical protein